MNILLLTSSYPPEIRSSSHLMQELAEGLRDRGHTVTVATVYPGHNLAGGGQELHFDSLTIEDGIEVLRIKTLPPHKVPYLVRGISQVLLPYVFSFRIQKLIRRRVDVIIVYSPPLPLAIAGSKLKKLHNAKYILNVQDLFPQNAIDLGILKNRLLIKLFEHIEAEAYRNADIIAVHSESNKSFLTTRKGVPQEKIRVLHNWIDVAPFNGIHRTGKFRKLFGLEDKFVLLFAGVIGPSQGLDMIIRTAYQLQKDSYSDICFLIIGDGTEKQRLVQMVNDLGLRNVQFGPFVSKDQYPLLVKDADVGLVSLSNKNKTPVVPGKILGYMAASIPVIAFLNKESDGHKIIKDARCGYSEVSDNVEKAVKAIIKIYNECHRLKEYGENGFNYVIDNFEKGVCIRHLEKLF